MNKKELLQHNLQIICDAINKMKNDGLSDDEIMAKLKQAEKIAKELS